MLVFLAFASLLSGASVVLASPLIPRLGNCNVSSATPDLPSGQTNVTVPSGQSPAKIALGVGVQNYTCTDAGAYTSAGAVADLYDISCLYGSPYFSSIGSIAFDVWNASTLLTTADMDAHLAPLLGVYAQHYFATSPSGSGISPVFDARATSHQGDPNALVLARKTGDLPAPTGKQDVDWLALANVQGDLAKTVLRLDTSFGQPPSSCTPGSALISVKYTAKYWFYS